MSSPDALLLGVRGRGDLRDLRRAIDSSLLIRVAATAVGGCLAVSRGYVAERI